MGTEGSGVKVVLTAGAAALDVQLLALGRVPKRLGLGSDRRNWLVSPRAGVAHARDSAASSEPNTMVLADVNMLPTPWATLIFTPRTCAAASPRTWRIDSCIKNMP